MFLFCCRYEETKNLKESNLRDSHKGQFKINTSLPMKKKKEANDVEGVKNNKQISRAGMAEIELIDNHLEPSIEDLPGNLTSKCRVYTLSQCLIC